MQCVYIHTLKKLQCFISWKLFNPGSDPVLILTLTAEPGLQAIHITLKTTHFQSFKQPLVINQNKRNIKNYKM